MARKLVIARGQPEEERDFTVAEQAQFAADGARPKRVPRRIGKLGLMRALRAGGHWGAVRSAIARAGADAREDWDAAALVDRGDSVFAAIYADAGLTPEQVDAAFRAGEGL